MLVRLAAAAGREPAAPEFGALELGAALFGGPLLGIRSLLSRNGRGSRKNHPKHRRQSDGESGNRCELSNHSFSSRCRAWWRTVALGPNLGDERRLCKEHVRRNSRRELTRSGKDHLINFDADFAR